MCVCPEGINNNGSVLLLVGKMSPVSNIAHVNGRTAPVGTMHNVLRERYTPWPHVRNAMCMSMCPMDP